MGHSTPNVSPPVNARLLARDQDAQRCAAPDTEALHAVMTGIAEGQNSPAPAADCRLPGHAETAWMLA